MTWALWSILGGLLCDSALIMIAILVFWRWGCWNAQQRLLATAGWANQLFHGLVMIVIGVLSMRVDRQGMPVAALLLLLGTAVTSGGLYGALFGLPTNKMRFVTLGGASLLCLGWSTLLVTLLLL